MKAKFEEQEAAKAVRMGMNNTTLYEELTNGCNYYSW